MRAWASASQPLSHLTLSLLALSLLALSHSAPLQWQKIDPVGVGPLGRYGHILLRFDTDQSSILLYSGLGYLELENDLWTFNTADRGWQEVELETQVVDPSTCATSTVNTQVPGGRYLHAGASSGLAALSCGGIVSYDEVVLGAEGQGVECWWLTPYPTWVFSKLQLQPGSQLPVPRHSFVMEYDSSVAAFIMHGGQGAESQVLSDCWYLKIEEPSAITTSQHSWQRCTTSGTMPPARYGHSSAFSDRERAFYIFGGLGTEGALNDLWKLEGYEASSAVWQEVMPASERPVARAYHSMWVAGSKLFITGGQGQGGEGLASVLTDTWNFDVFTLVWHKVAISDTIPTASHLQVHPTGPTSAFAFGGMGPDFIQTGQQFTFDTASGWTRSVAAGIQPFRRVGHIATYLSTGNVMVIYGGMTTGGQLLSDQWSLSMRDHIWRKVTRPEEFSPGPLAFSHQATAGIYHFVFGGIKARTCSSTEGGLVFEHNTQQYVYNQANARWMEVAVPGTAQPAPRLMGAMASFGPTSGKRNPLFLFGGATFECPEASGGRCPYPQPLNDAWILEGSGAEDPVDKMAVFDGFDDIVAIELPKWCSKADAVSALWIESWVFATSPEGLGEVILFDVYNDDRSLFRWILEASTLGLGVRLVFDANGGNEALTTFRGEQLGRDFRGSWHHVAFTLRFGRAWSSVAEVGLRLAQAHMFVDGVAMHKTGVMANPEPAAYMETGFTHILVGGPKPSVASSTSNFAGALDSVRVWWPDCLPVDDPSRCNPYAFAFPVDKQGNRFPEAGIHDKDVQMHHVAKPILDHVFSDDVAGVDSLLLSLDFRSGEPAGRLEPGSVWAGPAKCQDLGVGRHTSAYCPGCEKQSECTFGNCNKWSTQCFSDEIDSPSNLLTAFDPTRHTCDCLALDGCPTNVKDCKCPANSYRACASCAVPCMMFQDNGDGTYLALDPNTATNGNNAYKCDNPSFFLHEADYRFLAPSSCPDEICEQWTCVPFNPKNLGEGVLSSNVQPVDANGTVDWCPNGVETYGEEACCTGYFGNSVICREWVSEVSTTECFEANTGCITLYTCVDALPGDKCGIETCCDATTGLRAAAYSALHQSSSASRTVTPSTAQSPNPVPHLVSQQPAIEEETTTLHALSRRSSLQSGASSHRHSNPAAQPDGPRVLSYSGVGTKRMKSRDQSTGSSPINASPLPWVQGPGARSLDPASLAKVKKMSENTAEYLQSRSKRSNSVSADPAAPSVRQPKDSEFPGSQGAKQPRPVSPQPHGKGSQSGQPASFQHPTEVAAENGRHPAKTSKPWAIRAVASCQEQDDDPLTEQELKAWSSYVELQWTTEFQTSGGFGSQCESYQSNVVEAWATTYYPSGCEFETRTSHFEEGWRWVEGVTYVQYLSVSTFMKATCVQALLQESARDDLRSRVAGLAQAVDAGNITKFDLNHHGSLCGDGVVSGDEECEPFSAGDLCRSTCDSCIWPHTADPSAKTGCNCMVELTYNAFVHESTQAAGAMNTIKLDFVMLTHNDNGAGRMIITVRGLGGSPTPSNPKLPLECVSHTDHLNLIPDSDRFLCPWVVPHPLSEDPSTSFGHANWDKERGELTFELWVTPVCVVNWGCYPFYSFFFSLQNPTANPLQVSTEVKVCGVAAQLPFFFTTMVQDTAQPAVLSGRYNELVMGNTTLSAAASAGSEAQNVIAIEIPDALPAGASFSAEVIGIQSDRTLPSGSSGAGPLYAAIHFDLQGAEALSSAATLTFEVDTEVTARQGGCAEDSEGDFRICVRGEVGVYKLDSGKGQWQPQRQDRDSTSKQLSVEATDFSTWAVLSTVPCCPVNGVPQACGDRICLSLNHEPPVIVLGGSSTSRSPALVNSTRDRITHFGNSSAAPNASASARFLLRSGWKRILSDTESGATCSHVPAVGWPSARFGFAMATISSSRILIYGGQGCSVAGGLSFSGTCPTCSSFELLSDLWEFDYLKEESGAPPFSQIEISTQPGSMGLTAGALPQATHQLFVQGGTKDAGVLLNLILGLMPNSSAAQFELTTFFPRTGAVGAFEVQEQPQQAGHVAVSNDTHVIFFGGVVANGLSAVVYTYQLTAYSAAVPDVGLAQQQILTQGPAARAYPTIAKPTETSLVVFGGVEETGGLSDLWVLQVDTSRFTRIHDDSLSTAPAPRRFSSGTMLNFGDVGYVMCTTGGFLDSGQIEAEVSMHIYYAENLVAEDPAQRATWYEVMFLPSVTYEPRAMHVAVQFEVEREVVLYGGVNQAGEALEDVILVMFDDIDGERHDVYEVYVAFNLTGTALSTTGWAGTSWSDFEYLIFQFMSGANSFYQLGVDEVFLQNWRFSRVDYEPGYGLNLMRVYFWISETHFWNSFGKTIYATAIEYDVALLWQTFSNGLAPTDSWHGVPLWVQGDMLHNGALDDIYSRPYKQGLTAFPISQTKDCREGCIRGVCRDANGQTLKIDGETSFCYADYNPCSSLGLECSRPGKRHGVAGLTFNHYGVSPTLILFGGDASDLSQPPNFVSSVHILYSLRWGVFSTRPGLEDAFGVACYESGSVCPSPRRDAAVAIVGNTGGSNGKLLIFGGLVASADATRGIASYIERVQNTGLVAMSDLWYLNLEGLTDSCVQTGNCVTRLPWTKIEVLGSTPTPRWGSGLLLDPSDNLYVVGGVTISSSGTYSELSDIFVFQLRDAYFKKCSATGSSLSAAVAGIEAVFYLQCRDSFDDPTSTARFQVEITGPVDMKPTVTSLGNGEYECRYNPAVASKDYVITIKVGRGGSLFQDLITGEDADPTNSVHEYTGSTTTDQNPYSLAISPGATNPSTSLAMGAHITLTTAGTSSSFTIFAMDAFSNRRPGGDVVEAQMDLRSITDGSIRPTVATVVDNADGSYLSSYIITRAGTYSLSLFLNGKIGASTPVDLTVETGSAVIENTFFYGNLGCVNTGKASNLFIQLSDRFGNPMRLGASALEAEQVVFEPCIQRGEAVNAGGDSVCLGGRIDSSVSVQYDYGYGPDGTQIDPLTGETYHGLIRVTYFPFQANDIIPEVKHRGTYVLCFFPIGAEPPQQAILDCRTSVAQDQTVGTRRNALKRNERQLLQVADTCADASSRRNERRQTNEDVTVEALRPEQRTLKINPSFQSPDTTVMERLLFWVPIAAGMLGVVIESCFLAIKVLRERQAKEASDQFESQRLGSLDIRRAQSMKGGDSSGSVKGQEAQQLEMSDGERLYLQSALRNRDSLASVSSPFSRSDPQAVHADVLYDDKLRAEGRGLQEQQNYGPEELRASLDQLQALNLLSPSEHIQATILAKAGDRKVNQVLEGQAQRLASSIKQILNGLGEENAEAGRLMPQSQGAWPLGSHDRIGGQFMGLEPAARSQGLEDGARPMRERGMDGPANEGLDGTDQGMDRSGIEWVGSDKVDGRRSRVSGKRASLLQPIGASSAAHTPSAMSSQGLGESPMGTDGLRDVEQHLNPTVPRPFTPSAMTSIPPPVLLPPLDPTRRGGSQTHNASSIHSPGVAQPLGYLVDQPQGYPPAQSGGTAATHDVYAPGPPGLQDFTASLGLTSDLLVGPRSQDWRDGDLLPTSDASSRGDNPNEQILPRSRGAQVIGPGSGSSLQNPQPLSPYPLTGQPLSPQVFSPQGGSNTTDLTFFQG